jgi:DNA-binding transcriptional MerR regulator
MATTSGDYKSKRYRFFFLNGRLYRSVYANSRTNIISVMDVETGEYKQFLFSDVRKHAQQAFKIGQVAKMLGVRPGNIMKYEREGLISPAPRWAGFDRSYEPKRQMRLFSEDHVREIRDAMSEVHRGRPRKDGIITPRSSLPTAAELEAKINKATILYEEVDGEMIPIWRNKF